jgi:hypothetical protein
MVAAAAFIGSSGRLTLPFNGLSSSEYWFHLHGDHARAAIATESHTEQARGYLIGSQRRFWRQEALSGFFRAAESLVSGGKVRVMDFLVYASDLPMVRRSLAQGLKRENQP